MNILSIHGGKHHHDSSALIMRDYRVVASADEERFNRSKHYGGFPFYSIEFCLDESHLTMQDIDLVVVPFDYYYMINSLKEKINKYKLNDSALCVAYDHLNDFNKIKDVLKSKYGDFKAKVIGVNHHLAHAYSAWYVNQSVKKSLILVVDGFGDIESASLFSLNNKKIKRECVFLDYPESIGSVYSSFTHQLGFRPIHDTGKLMGLAAFGEIDKKLLENVYMFSNSNKPVSIDISYFGYYDNTGWISQKGVDYFGKRHNKRDEFSPLELNIAATCQFYTEESVLKLALKAKSLFPSFSNIMISGGVGLNIVANRKIVESKLFDKCYFTPASGDQGVTLGAAFAAYNKNVFRRIKKYNYNFSVYLGKEILDSEVNSVISSLGIESNSYEYLDTKSLISFVAKKLAEGKIIAWVQGKAEWGPRALGNRSILANPLIIDIKSILDSKVKKREKFRPYACSVIDKYFFEYFEGEPNEYMLLENKVIEKKIDIIRPVVHINGTCRVQYVKKEHNHKFYELLENFYLKTGCPILLNTSFNMHGEPIVNTAEDCIKDFYNSGIDILVINNFIFKTKQRVPN